MERRLEVVGLISDERRLGCTGAVGRQRVPQHRRAGLALWTLEDARAGEDAIDERPALAQPGLQRGMHGIELPARHRTPSDLGLIGADRNGDTRAVEPADRLGGAVDQHQLLGPLDVVAAVDDNHAIAIEEAETHSAGNAADGHGFRRDKVWIACEMTRTQDRPGTSVRNAAVSGKSMYPRTDIELVCADLRRWRQDVARQDCSILRQAWRATVRSHMLLEKPVYTASGRPSASCEDEGPQGSAENRQPRSRRVQQPPFDGPATAFAPNVVEPESAEVLESRDAVGLRLPVSLGAAGAC